jgi:hypothetical protein
MLTNPYGSASVSGLGRYGGITGSGRYGGYGGAGSGGYGSGSGGYGGSGRSGGYGGGGSGGYGGGSGGYGGGGSGGYGGGGSGGSGANGGSSRSGDYGASDSDPNGGDNGSTAYGDSSKEKVGKGRRGSGVGLDERPLGRIAVSAEAGRNIGLLRARDKLRWPPALQSSRYAGLRTEVDSLVSRAVWQARYGQPVGAEVVTDLRVVLQKLRDALRADIMEMSLREYLDACSYLKQFDQALSALRAQNRANYLNDTRPAKGGRKRGKGTSYYLY